MNKELTDFKGYDLNEQAKIIEAKELCEKISNSSVYDVMYSGMEKGLLVNEILENLGECVKEKFNSDSRDMIDEAVYSCQNIDYDLNEDEARCSCYDEIANRMMKEAESVNSILNLLGAELEQGVGEYLETLKNSPENTEYETEIYKNISFETYISDGDIAKVLNCGEERFCVESGGEILSAIENAVEEAREEHEAEYDD